MISDVILLKSDRKYELFPIKYQDIWDLYKQSCQSVWFVEEIKLSDDYNQFQKLDKKEQYLIKNILTFFANIDSVISDNIITRFYDDVQIQEARQFFTFQMLTESIHQETYQLLIDVLIQDQQEKLQLFQAFENSPVIQKKIQFCKKYLSGDQAFNERLVAFMTVECIQFCTSFCVLFWYKKRGILPGLTFSNELISRDESTHVQHAILIYNHLIEKLPQQKIEEIIRESTDIECSFIQSILPENLVGMNQILMKQYAQYVADWLLYQLTGSKIYNVNNPFDFMNLISLQTKTNFFESRNASYKKANIFDSKNENNNQFDLNSEF